VNTRLIAISTAAAVAGSIAFAGAAAARDQIRIVGSSTVYPFTTAVAEQFGKSGSGKTPVVESTGTGGGMKLFCAGVGEAHPDLTNASRAMKKSEFEDCQKNGVKDIVEIKVGIDGLTIAQSKDGPAIKLTIEQVFLALAEQVPDKDGKLVANPYKNWSDIASSLPNVKIEVLGPPPTSGTRDSFHELFLEVGAKKIASLKDMQKADAKGFEKLWKSIRKDGAYVEAGENDNVIVQKLDANKNAFGIFGYSFLEENTAKLQDRRLGRAHGYNTCCPG
jgi:phosphate transport system substrate-binding protein